MVGTTLIELREHVEALASEDGSYYVVCGRTGERPIPTDGLRFDRRLTAQRAAKAAERYRSALRRYDSRLPFRDLIVCQSVEATDGLPPAAVESGDKRESVEDREVRSPSVVPPSSSDGRDRLVEFCHGAAAAVFETLCDEGYRSVETAVMDEYLDLAEAVADPDDLCLCLLESMAVELDERLSPTAQAEVLSNAAARLPTPNPSPDPVSATFARLRRLGLLGSYTQSPWSVDFEEGVRTVAVDVAEYALSPRNGRLPVLPLVLDLSRRRLDWSLSALHIDDATDGWRVTLVLERDAEPTGLTNVPIRSEV